VTTDKDKTTYLFVIEDAPCPITPLHRKGLTTD